MKLLFLTSGAHTPSTRFRILPLVPYLLRAGHACTVAHSIPEKYDHFPWLGYRLSYVLKRCVRYLHWLRALRGQYDAIILERELFHNKSWDLERLFRRTTRTLVLDVDDGVFLNFPDKFPHLVRMSDWILAGNRFLKDWLQPFDKPVTIVPTCIDTHTYQPAPAGSPTYRPRPVIGWMGTASNIEYLRGVTPALRSLARRRDFELRVIATHRGNLDDLDLEGVQVQFQKWNGDSEATDIRDFDIGIMPLSDDEWSRYKCGLKLLQYMAVGVPGVASPVGVNAEIVSVGENGYLATTPEQWEASLDQLLADPPLRQRLGIAARQTVEQRYSIEANLPVWIAAVEQAIRSTS